MVYIRGFIGCIVALPKIPVSQIIDNSALPALTENMGVSSCFYANICRYRHSGTEKDTETSHSPDEVVATQRPTSYP